MKHRNMPTVIMTAPTKVGIILVPTNRAAKENLGRVERRYILNNPSSNQICPKRAGTNAHPKTPSQRQKWSKTMKRRIPRRFLWIKGKQVWKKASIRLRDKWDLWRSNVQSTRNFTEYLRNKTSISSKWRKFNRKRRMTKTSKIIGGFSSWKIIWPSLDKTRNTNCSVFWWTLN